MSVTEISALQTTSREPFSSVGMVCACGRAVAGMEGVVMECAGCGVAYIVSVMQLKRAVRPASSTAPEAQPKHRDSGDAQSASCGGDS